MPDNEPSSGYERITNQYKLSVSLFGSLRPARDLHRQTQRVVKAHSGDRDHFTEITLSEGRNGDSMNVEYFVKAKSPSVARRVGRVYLSQLCDLVSAVTECPVQFFLNDNDAREERGRQHREATKSTRTLTAEEWSWVTGSLVAMRRDHPRYLAAASWYRKGLIGDDCLECFCCFWRVIERIADSYADKSDWAKGDGGVRKCIAQLTSDLFDENSVPAILADDKHVKALVDLRNDISHGNVPITVEMIEFASEQLEPLQEAAFAVLDCLRRFKLKFDI